VAVVITLKEHLTALEKAENDKPPLHRRHVPTIPELAEAAGMSRQALYNIINGQIKQINLETLASIIDALTIRGFSVDVPDLIKTYPKSEVGAGSSE
jgi:DNA-binding Xre family transcriptional regulator